jgi:putative methyltransferase (TIGR04325 family)
VRQFIPQLFINIKIRILQRKISWITKFETYEKALKACQKTGYRHAELIEVVVEKNLIHREALKIDPTIELETLRTLIPLIITGTMNEINVLDFGGGSGQHYLIAKTVLDPSYSINWNVVETSEMVNQAKKIAFGSCKFFDNINSAREDMNKIDLVFTSSALQYCPDPLLYLQKLVDLDAPFFFLTRTPFLNDLQEIITIQFSKLANQGPGPMPLRFKDKIIAYPITYTSREKVEKIIKEKYDIRFRIDEGSENFYFNNEPISCTGYLCVRKITSFK